MLTKNDNARLDRLASETRGGGGLVLPSLFGAMLEELLDNEKADYAHMVSITKQVCSNKTKKLAETWSGSWEYLTNDALGQLVHKGYVAQLDSEWWRLGENFKPGISLETIQARNGLNSADHVTVWLKDEREARADTAYLDTEVEQMIQQPRGRSHNHQIMNELRSSKEQDGYLDPVIVDARGVTIDGRHRLEIDPNWPKHVMEHITTDEQVIAAIIGRDTWYRKGQQKLSDNAREKIIAIQGKAATQSQIKRARIETELRADAARSNSAIAELVGVRQTLVAAVRKLSEESEDIHCYVNRSRWRTEHSVECWCGEGEATPPKPRGPRKPDKPPKQRDPALLSDIRNGELTARAEGRDQLARSQLDEIAQQHGVSATLARRSHAYIQGQLDESVAPQPEPSSPQQQRGCAHSNVHQVVICDGCGAVVDEHRHS